MNNMNTYYVINTYMKQDYVSTSDILPSIEKAKQLKTSLDKNTELTNIIYKCEPVDICNKMTLHKIVNGYLLRPNKDHTYYGMNKLNGGYWLDDLEGWFYDKSYYDDLINQGYKLKTTENELFKYKHYNISKLDLIYYKSGFLLLPNTNYKYYGQHYLLGGIWDRSKNGWYFKNMKKYKVFSKLGAADAMGQFLE